MTRDIEFRLLGHESDEGELLATDAINIIRSFKELAYRLTRAVSERSGLGRAEAALERLSTVRVSLKEGSTRVVFKVGDDAALDLVDPITRDVDTAFWDIVIGVRDNRRPTTVSDTVADAVEGVILALERAAPVTEVTVPGYGQARLDRNQISREPWKRTDLGEPTETTVHGRLDMVDLRSARFRLRDAAHNSIDLVGVKNVEHAALLVGQLVSATGLLSPGRESDHHKVDGAVVVPSKVRDMLGHPMPSLEEALAAAAKQAPVPEPLDLTLDELESFLAAIHGR